MNERHIKAPNCYDPANSYVFLAGTIDNGNSEDWQQKVADYVIANSDYHILNPRRDSWNPAWEQTITNPQFKEQVTWELNGLNFCDVALMYITKDSLSPITLMELGLFARNGRVHVCCEQGYWRRGNVEVVCDIYNIPLYDDLDKMLQTIFPIKR